MFCHYKLTETQIIDILLINWPVLKSQHYYLDLNLYLMAVLAAGKIQSCPHRHCGKTSSGTGRNFVNFGLCFVTVPAGPSGHAAGNYICDHSETKSKNDVELN